MPARGNGMVSIRQPVRRLVVARALCRVLLALALFRMPGLGQTIATVAGVKGGTLDPWNGVSGIATAAHLAMISGGGLAISAQGLYVSQDDKIALVTSDGMIRRFASVGDARGLSVDGIGNVYVANFGGGNSGIWKITPAGAMTQIGGNGDPTVSSGVIEGAALSVPVNAQGGIAVDRQGNVYVADYGYARVRKVSTNGMITTVAGNGSESYSGDDGPATAAGIGRPQYIAVDAAGAVYIPGPCTIRKIENGIIRRFAGTGTCGFSGDGGPASAAQLSVGALTFDAAGNLYFAGEYRIRRISPAGTISTVLGNGQSGWSPDGTPVLQASSGNIHALAVGSDGTLYYADYNQVRKIAPGTCVSPTITVPPQSTSTANGITVTLSVTATGANLSYQWYQGAKGDTSKPVGTNIPTLLVTTTSTQSYWVRISSPCGSTDSNTATVTITPAVCTITSCSVTAPTAASTGTSVAFQGSITTASCTGTTTYAWTFGDATSTATQANTTHTYSSSGNYNWTFNAKNATATCTKTGTISVAGACVTPVITTQPQSRTINNGETVNTFVVATGTGLTYQWYVGNTGDISNPVPGGTGQALNGTPLMTTSFWVRVKNSCGASADSATATITVRTTQCTINSCNATVPGTGTAGAPVTFQATATANGCTTQPAYAWTFGDNTSQSNQATSTHTYTAAGTYTWRLSAASDTASCIKTGTIAITSACAPPVIASQPQSVTIRSGQSITTFVVATGAGLSYQWYVGVSGDTSQPIAGAITQSLGGTPLVTTSFWVRVRNSCGVVDSATATITVSADCALTCAATAPATGDTGTTVPFRATVTATGCTGTTSFRWDFGDRMPGEIYQNPNHYYLYPGSYNWTVKATLGSASCTVGGTINITKGCSPLVIERQPQAATISAGDEVTLYVMVSDGTGVRYQWYEGAVGDTSHPVPGGNDYQLTVAPVRTTSYWARLTTACSSFDTPAGTVTVVASSCTLRCDATVPSPRVVGEITAFTGVVTATACTAPVSSEWSFGDNTGTVSGVSVVHTYRSVGAYEWVLSASSASARCSKTGTITIAKAYPPYFMPQGVVTGVTPGLVPGSLATIYGRNFGSGVLQAEAAPWPTILGRTRVVVGGVVAPLSYVGSGQINFQVPWEVAGQSGATVVVENDGLFSDAVNVPVFSAQPYVAPGWVLHSNFQPVTAEDPALPGEVLVLYAVGLGSVSPQPATGAPAPLVPPLANVLDPAFGVTIGSPASVLYAGLAGGYVGLYQVNARVPDITPSGVVPVLLTSGGTQISKPVLLPVTRTGDPAAAGYVELFDGTHPSWRVNDQDGPGGITRVDNVLFPNEPGVLGACSTAQSSVGTLTVLVPGINACAAAYKTYQDENEGKLRGAGGQLQLTNAVHFGYYEVAMMSTDVPGTVSSMFVFSRPADDRDANEVDIEILSKDNDPAHDRGVVHFTVFLPEKRVVTYGAGLGFAPWKGFHRYGFDWQAEGIHWYVDGSEITISSCTTTMGERTVENAQCFLGVPNVPQRPGFLFVNHWTNGGSWSGPQPLRDALLAVRSVAVLRSLPH